MSSPLSEVDTHIRPELSSYRLLMKSCFMSRGSRVNLGFPSLGSSRTMPMSEKPKAMVPSPSTMLFHPSMLVSGRPSVIFRKSCTDVLPA